MTIGFTGGWLDRDDRLRVDAEAVAAAARDRASRLLRLDDGEPRIDDDGRLVWSAMDAATGTGELLFLGTADGIAHFTELAPGARYEPMRSPTLNAMLTAMPAREAAVFGTARSLLDWHSRNRFCANCGTATAPLRGGWARQCPACATEHYPRVDPVVIMLAECDGRALLGRGAGWPRGRYSALAGFVEPGETIEEAVAREVHEETGVRVRDVRYVASQPWPFPGQLMIGAFATADAPELTIDAHEIEAAIWVTRDEVRAALAGGEAPFVPPPPYAIAHTLLTRWVEKEQSIQNRSS